MAGKKTTETNNCITPTSIPALLKKERPVFFNQICNAFINCVKILESFFPCKTFFKSQKQPPELFYKKVILKSFTKFTGKHLSQSLFFNKGAGLSSATLAHVFSCEFCEIFRNTSSGSYCREKSVNFNVINPFQFNVLFFYF